MGSCALMLASGADPNSISTRRLAARPRPPLLCASRPFTASFMPHHYYGILVSRCSGVHAAGVQKRLPVAVGGMGMISTANYVARRFGVRSAMPGFIGKRLCPKVRNGREKVQRSERSSARCCVRFGAVWCSAVRMLWVLRDGRAWPCPIRHARACGRFRMLQLPTANIDVLISPCDAHCSRLQLCRCSWCLLSPTSPNTRRRRRWCGARSSRCSGAWRKLERGKAGARAATTRAA